MRSEFGLNNGFPRPKSNGVRARLSSSNSPCFRSVEERSALPKTNKVLPEIGRAHGLNSSHGYISYAVFCLKKKKTKQTDIAPHDPHLSTAPNGPSNAI